MFTRQATTDTGGMSFANEDMNVASCRSTFARSGGFLTLIDTTGGMMTLLETVSRTLPESIANLELGYIGCKLLDDDAFEAQRRDGELLWDEERVARALGEYKQFLALMYWNPEANLVPSEDIDDVWHTHVLHTARYHADCEAIFGCFQDHCPAGGASAEFGDEHAEDRDETLQLFEEAFGEIPRSYTVITNARCRRTASEMRCRRTTVNGRCRRATAEMRCRRISADL
jgi:hypothetical protein